MGVASGRRVSQTEMKATAGFRAELPGLDLATLVQLMCARRERMVARVSSYGDEGFLYSAAGRIVHAALGDLVGEEAALRMLGWHTGDFAPCQLPFPETATIQRSTEGLLALAAQRADDSALDEVLTLLPPQRSDARVREQRVEPIAPLLEPDEAEPARAQARSSAPPSAARVSEPEPPSAQVALTRLRESVLPSAPAAPPPQRSERTTMLPSAEPLRARSIPPPPPASLRRPAAQSESVPEPSLVASVKVDARGALVSSHGSAEHLAQLVAYVAHLVALIQADFALDAFQALDAELAGLRVLVFQEAGDLVGLLMHPGPASQELRQRLGV